MRQRREESDKADTMVKGNDNPTDEGGRDARVAAIMGDVILRRNVGEDLSDEQVLGCYPNLVGELTQALRDLSRIEIAEQQAQSGGAHSGSDTGVDGLPRWLTKSIAGYKIQNLIARGGQGEVYRAIQDGTRRDVAIKLMHGGPLHGVGGKARFIREVQILGQLKHPHIVTIHDTGVASGRAYFVMDYISGRPLDEYVAKQDLSVNDALRLFVKICDAVNAGHLRGIMHRDLKPSNIHIDEAGDPHILDFGLAKSGTAESNIAQQFSTGDSRALTVTGQFVGSLPWASPEQADGASDQIDLRTDVYSLGVVLYQVLTGGFPYCVTCPTREAMRNIVEADPIKPSSICKSINDEVETIVLKCLEKEPGRRYQSAAALSEDIERYLTGQPILARAPSTMYQVRKLVQRNKLFFVLFVASLSLLVGFTIWMGVMYARVEGERSRVEAERTRATLAEQEAEERRIEATREALKAQAINQFLISDLLGATDPAIAQGKEITVKEVLEKASERIDARFDDQPLVKAEIHSVIGHSYMSVALYGNAEKHARQAERILAAELGDEHPDTLRAQLALSNALIAEDRLVEAESLSVQTLAVTRRLFGEEHELTLQAAHQRACLHLTFGQPVESQELHRRTLELRRRLLGDDHPATISSIDVWGCRGLRMQGRTAEAEQYCRQVLEYWRDAKGPDDPATLEAMFNLGGLLSDQGQSAEAELLLRHVHERSRFIFVDEHGTTRSAAVRLAILLRNQGRIDDAETLLREGVEIARAAFGVDHPQTQEAMQYLGGILARQGNYPQAAKVFGELLEIRKRRYGDENPGTVVALICHSANLFRLGRYYEAEDGFRRALAQQRRTFGDHHVHTLWAGRWLTKTLAAEGKLDEARPVAQRLLESRRQLAQRPDADADQLGRYARELATVEPSDLRDPEQAIFYAQETLERVDGHDPSIQHILALAYDDLGEDDKAIEAVRQALMHTPIEVSWARTAFEKTLVRFLDQADEYEAAEQVYRSTLAARREHFHQSHPDIAASLFDLANLLLTHEEHIEAEAHLRECLEMREAVLGTPGADTYRLSLTCDTVRTRVALARSLVGQGRFADAESLLLNAYKELAQASYCHSAFLPDTLKRLIALYEAWDRETAAGEFRNILAQTCLSQECYP